MKEILFTLTLFFVCPVAAQQTLTETFSSTILSEDRTIRIHLPASFEEETDTISYPLILTLDGDYMFYAIVGHAAILQVRQKMPEAIIVGINQNYLAEQQMYARWTDCQYDNQTGLPKAKGKLFQQFITQELLPHLTQKYKVGSFKAICGHSFTANFINYFLLDKTVTFSAYLAFSPYIPSVLEKPLAKSIRKKKQPIFYYLNTGSADLSRHRKAILQQDSTLFSKIKKDHFYYLLDNFAQATHYSVISSGLSPALEHIFSIYAPIHNFDYDRIARKKDLIAYLTQKYENIKRIYGLDMPVRTDDLDMIAWMAEEKKDWQSLQKIAQWYITLYPNKTNGYYTAALCAEKQANFKEALRLYKQGYANLGEDILNKDQFYEDIVRVEKILAAQRKHPEINKD